MEVYQYKFSYCGKGSDLFQIRIVNAILCIITLGLYYPWAKARTLQYLYSQSTFQDQPFAFTGTGNQMFKGLLKVIAGLIIFYGILIPLSIKGHNKLAMLLGYIFLFGVIPLAVHGFFKYRMSKTKWQGINFSYEGKLNKLYSLYFSGILLTIITLGIYGAWFSMNIRRYIIGNISIGDAKFNYTGHGSEFFLMNLKGYILTILTLGIYYFWWKKDQYDFFVANTNLKKGEQIVILKTNVSGGDFAGLLLGNFFLIIFTLGLGTAWAITRNMKFYAKYIDMYGDLDLNDLRQSDSVDFSDASGEDLSGVLDIGAII